MTQQSSPTMFPTFPLTLAFEITQAHIATGERCIAARCALSLAIRTALTATYPGLRFTILSGSDGVDLIIHNAPKTIRAVAGLIQPLENFVLAFDEGKPVAPCNSSVTFVCRGKAPAQPN